MMMAADEDMVDLESTTANNTASTTAAQESSLEEGAKDASLDAFACLEQVLFHERSVWFYQVPPGQISTLSPRADSWDPEHPFMTGSVHIVQRGDDCFIRLYEPTALDTAIRPTLFAQCPVEITKELGIDVYVQDCADSSRYFMIRVEDEQTKRRAYIGIGFPERSQAFNFKATLQDYVKYRHRQMEAAALASAGVVCASKAEETEESQASKSRDFSLPAGATIRIQLKKSGQDDQKEATTVITKPATHRDPDVKKIPLLPPPPSASSSTTEVHDDDDDDWGDFTSA